MRRYLSILLIVLFILESNLLSAYTSQNKLRVGFLGVFVDDREDVSLSLMVTPMFSDSDFFVWERITKDTPISEFWGLARIEAKFQHNSTNVSGRFTLYIKDPSSSLDMFVLDAKGISSTFSGMVADWTPLEKEAFLNGLTALSKELEDLWRSNSIVTYAEGNVFECDIGRAVGIVEGSLLSVFRDNRFIARGKVTSVDQKKCKAEIIYNSGDKPPAMGDMVKISYIPSTPEVSFLNQASSVVNAIAGIAILAGIVVLYNIARANALPRITLIAPSDGREFKTGETISFSWISNHSMKQYKIQIIKGTSIVYEETLTDTPFSYPTQLAPGLYSWKVIGYMEDGTSVESETRTFSLSQ